MKLRAEREKLLKVLSKVQNIADRKSSMAILSTVLFEVKEGGIEISATDLEIGFKSFVEAEVEEEGALAIPARKFYEIVKDFPSETLDLVEEDSWLKISGANEEVLFKLACLPAEDFPALPEIEETTLLEIPGSVFSEMIAKTIFCVATEESRFILAGIYMEQPEEEKTLRFVATDGHRLAMIDREINNVEGLELSPGVIVPRKACQEMRKLAQDQVLVQFGVKENHVILAAPNMMLTARLIDGRYPDYRAVIPQTKEKIVVVPRKRFIEALKRVSVISIERFRPVTLEVSPEAITIVSQHPDLGEGREKVAAQYQGEAFSLNFNAKYLVDCLEVMNSEEVELSMKDENTPCTITGPSDQGFLGLVMPMSS
ncbi:MAG: DNA polymerase III subunit beta [Thermodesulfobacteria bacterium]|nr:DNA polymerase III subunit beta [Thermodesulfobacteriota bacterium]